jgi:argininosuccinate lyase
MAKTQKPWEHAKAGGSESDELAARFVESLSYDTRLYAHDIAGSLAHARMLQQVGLISEDDLAAIEQGLEEIQAEISEQGGAWAGWKIELEDVHMCIEAALIEKIGEPGRKLHTGRSRNDQVATDLMLWTRDASEDLTDSLAGVMVELVNLAERQGELVMPAYTHLQRAQPILLGAELLAWIEALGACASRLELSRSLDRLPLGSGAIAGSALPLDRTQVAEQLMEEMGGREIEGALAQMLGIDEQLAESANVATSIAGNSIHATATRDIALDFVYACAIISQWLSRWAEQWIIYMTSEFGFLTIGDAYTTGSSMMPQKRNPDMLELIRGRCGNVYGHLMALLTLCKGLTIGYNRDLQEDKRHVFAAYDTVSDCLEMATRIVRSARFDEQRIKASLDRGYLDATSLAEYLVTRGVPFRTAHQQVGSLVHHCLDNKIPKLADLSVQQMNQIIAEHDHSGAIAEDVYDWLGAENVVKRYQTYGNAGVSGFGEQLEMWRERLLDEQGG